MDHLADDAVPEALPAELAAGFNEGLSRLADPAGPWIAPPLAPVTLLERAERLQDPQAVRDALARFAARPGAVGWVETPQTLQALGEGRALPDGIPLHAELASGASSLQVRWADGAWVVTHQQEGAPEGRACWAHDVERLASLSGTLRWRYRVYLHAGADGTLQPFAARLAGADADT